MTSLVDSCIGCILGTAVGDAIGLPFEGLPPERVARRGVTLDGHTLFCGRGMVSDDTEHTCAVAQALISSGGEPVAFERALTGRLKVWMLGLPPGVGLATLRACARLLAGVPPQRSGVFSAGNGPSMRSAIIGVACGDDPSRLRELVHRSTRVTHTDPKAEHGARAVALAAHWSRTGKEITAYPAALRDFLSDGGAELCELIEHAAASAARGETTAQFARGMGWSRGISGYTYHTVPGALQAWMRHPEDLKAAVLEVVRCGGDTDSTAAIAGGIIGARVGQAGFPAPWLNGLCEWPRSVAWMVRLGSELAESMAQGEPRRAPGLSFPALLGRNALCLAVVSGHALRRRLRR